MSCVWVLYLNNEYFLYLFYKKITLRFGYRWCQNDYFLLSSVAI